MKIRFKQGLVSLICFGFGMCLTSASFAATSGSHYPFGSEGVLAGSAPPPGFYYRAYNVWYNPTKLMDDNGDELNVDFDLDIFSSVQRFVHVTNIKILGADLLYNVIVPLVSKDISIGAFGVSDSKSLSFGDISIEPFALAWHEPRWDAALGFAAIVPSGEYDMNNPASPGLGYWSGMMTAGGTFFMDEQRSWSLSALTRTLIHSEQDDTGVTPGSEFVVEYGIGKEFNIGKGLLVRPGLSGSAYWQLEDDSNDGPTTLATERKECYSAGAEINFFYLPKLVQLNLRVVKEYGAVNTSEGSQVILTFTKGW